MEDIFGLLMVLAGALIIGLVIGVSAWQRRTQTAPDIRSARQRDLDTIEDIRVERSRRE